MKKTSQYAAAPAAVENYEGSGPAFIIESAVVTRTHRRVAIQPDTHGATVGAMIDASMVAALESGDEMLDIAVHFERSDWNALRDSFHADKRTGDYDYATAR